MTDQEKKRISELRDQGKTYPEIAAETGIGLSAIKMHFKRLKPVLKYPLCKNHSETPYTRKNVSALISAGSNGV